MSKLPCIEIKHLSKTFRISDKGLSIKQRLMGLVTDSFKTTVHALKDINLDINEGENIGIIGKNGSGKSTLLKLILGSIDPDKGSTIITRGRVIRLALGMGFDISLSAKDNIYLNGTILGLSFKEIGEKFDEIIEFAELKKFVNTPVKYFSSGMKSRLSFAIAIHANADIYLIDEFFADVGDEAFKEKSQQVFESKIFAGKTTLHVSHSMQTIRKNCDKIFLLNQGSGILYNDIEEAFTMYKNLP